MGLSGKRQETMEDRRWQLGPLYGLAWASTGHRDNSQTGGHPTLNKEAWGWKGAWAGPSTPQSRRRERKTLSAAAATLAARRREQQGLP